MLATDVRVRRICFLILVALVFSVHDGSANSRFSTYRSNAAKTAMASASSASSETFSGYVVPSYVMATMGGVDLDKRKLMASGAVYVPNVLRPRFTRADPGWTNYGSMDDYAICRGHANATNATRHLVQFRYFLCPNDIHDIFNYQEKYCCGPSRQQFCCDKGTFFTQYGVLLPGTSVVVIVIAVISSILGTCLCCCVSVCCIAGLSDDDKKKLKSGPSVKRTSAVANNDAAAASAIAAAYPTYPSESFGLVALPPIVMPLSTTTDSDNPATTTTPLVNPPPPPYPGPL